MVIFRPVQLSTIYCRSILHLVSNSVGDVIARKHFLVPNNFEGNLFHRIYKDLQTKELHQVAGNLEELEVNIFYKVVTSKGTRIKKT